jgi:hypothetical protein
MPDDLTLAPSPAALLYDTDCPKPMRREALKSLVKSDNERARDALDKLLDRAAAGRVADHYAEKLSELEETMEQLQNGPVRAAVYIGPGHQDARRAHVLFSDNTEAQVFVPDEELVQELRRGDTVWVEPQGRAVLSRVPCGSEVGEIVRVESRVDAERVAVTQNEASRAAWRMSADLVEAFDRGEAGPGAEVIGCPSRRIAFSVVKNGEVQPELRYLERRLPMDIDLERDLGNPHAFIRQVAEHVETEMTQPELARSFGLGRSRALLLTGSPGTGKTYSIEALIRLIYEVMSRVVGVALEELPFRVLRMRPARVLSMWLGQSDKNMDSLFDQARRLADEKFVGPDGREHVLPVIVIGEEIDSLARARGHDAVHDRIQTTLLERFETSSQEWRDRLAIFLFTTNVPRLLDAALFRRAGGEVVRLRGLDRRSFAAVLEKQLRRRRLRESLGAADAARARLVEELAAWLFAPAADPGQVEIHLLGQPTPLVKHRRDLLTAALVQRAVDAASYAACRAGRAGDADPGLDRSALARALHDQVRALVEHLDPSNVAIHVELGRDAQVRAVVPIRQPALLGPELEIPATTASAR